MTAKQIQFFVELDSVSNIWKSNVSLYWMKSFLAVLKSGRDDYYAGTHSVELLRE